MKIDQIYKILNKSQWTSEERQELYNFIANKKNNQDLYFLLHEKYLQDLETGEKIQSDISAKIYDLLEKEIAEREKKSVKQEQFSGKNENNKYLKFIRIGSIAACLIIIIGAGVLYFTQKNKFTSLNANKHFSTLIKAGQNGAILTLADGKTIILDSSNTNVVCNQMGVIARKTRDGQILYQKTNTALSSAGEKWNTLTTPRGRNYRVVLPDGTQVWLNAEASLTYPILFSGKERIVQLSGEGYFEVAKNKSMPFIVKIFHNGRVTANVKVLGTHFNINSYNDEYYTTATLLEGSIEFKPNNNISKTLLPGQQLLQENRSGETRIKETGDNDVTAWVNGNFNFNNTSLEEIMKQISRWYNIDIVYQSNIPQLNFSGSISRTSSLEKVLKILEIGGIHFLITEKEIRVLPA
ncbi:MAG: DUF4974 domain-containing protein [Arachidicoccus sp.]|nr:DUF4974 domain-containing protein [Arachidicoccus sp.]